MARAWSWAAWWAWAAVVAVISARAAGRGGIKGQPVVSSSPGPRRMVVREGEEVKLNCPISGSPEPLYEWFKDGEEIWDTWSRYVRRKKTLKVRQVERDDSGTFTCVGVNGFGATNASISLIVLREEDEAGQLVAPTLTQMWPQTHQHRRRGDSFTFICRATGLPSPTITWHKDGAVLSKQGETLTLSRLKAEDSGSYTCVAASPMGSIAGNFSLTVREDGVGGGAQPEISEAVNTTVVTGGTTSLQCTVRTSHQPSVQWLKEISGEEAGGGGGAQVANTTQQLGGRWFRKVAGAGDVVARGEGHYLSKLTIRAADRSSAGVYVCLAVNSFGFSFREANLTVLPGPGERLPPVEQKEKSVNWLFLIIPATVVLAVVVAVIVCQLRKTPPDKPVGVSPPTPVLKGGPDDASALTPLNQDGSSRPPTLPRPPDLVYQEVTGYAPSSVRGGRGEVGGGGGQAVGGGHYLEQYPSPYQDASYLDPAYSDPYPGDRVPTRSSDHSYARLPHPSLASHTSHTSSSPHMPPPYPHQHPHTHSHTHRHPQQYFVHYNL